MSADPEQPATQSQSDFAPAPGAPLWSRVFGFPRTSSGWWAILLEVGFIILVTLFRVLVAGGQKGGAEFFSNPLLALTMIAAAASGIAGAVFGIISVIRRRERSLLIAVAVILGLLVLTFTIGELGGHH